DWSGYLGQQRRWARSVLDVRFRLYPKLAARLPRRERVINFLHGLYYLQGLVAALQIALVAIMLITAWTPHAFSVTTMPSFLILLAVLQIGEVYHQRFYLDIRHEAGWHWRVRVLEWAKLPYFLLALYDTLTQQ